MATPTSLTLSLESSRRYSSTIYVYNLPRQRNSNFSNKRKWFSLIKTRSRRYLAETMTDTNYADDLALFVNTPAQAESRLHNLEQAAGGIGFYVNANKTELICFKQVAISTLSGWSLKLVNKFTHLGSNISSTKSDVNIHLVKVWKAIDMLLIRWKTDLSEKIKRNSFQAVAVSILQYGCTTWMLMKGTKKKLDENYTRMLRTILNKSWKQHPTNSSCMVTYPLSHEPSKYDEQDMGSTAGRRKDQLISEPLLWILTNEHASADQSVRTYINCM